MKLTLKNIGKIKEAEIVLHGITVIAGPNDTGKSTLSRALYCVYNYFSGQTDQILSKKRELLSDALLRVLVNRRLLAGRRSDSRAPATAGAPGPGYLADALIDRPELWGDRDALELWLKKKLFDDPSEGITAAQHELAARAAEQAFNVLALDDEFLLKSLFSTALNQEFYGQINHVNTREPGEIALSFSDGRSARFAVIDNKVADRRDQVRHLGDLEAVYLDGVCEADEENYRSFYQGDLRHGTRLWRLLHRREDHDAVLRGRAANLEALEVLNRLLPRTLTQDQNGRLVMDLDGEMLRYGNLSSGVKVVAVLKRLLKLSLIPERGLLILDEPESRLNPQWIVVLARAIVLLQKELNLYVLIDTHSTEMVLALHHETVLAKTADRLEVYEAVNDDAGFSTFKHDPNSLDRVLSELNGPMDTLVDEEYDYLTAGDEAVDP